MAEATRITLHPIKEDGTLDLDVNLYPKTLLDGIVDRNNEEVRVLTAEEISELLYLKVDKVEGKELSSNDFNDDYKNKLEGIEAGAQVNPTNYVTTDTNQTILGQKYFRNGLETYLLNINTNSYYASINFNTRGSEPDTYVSSGYIEVTPGQFRIGTWLDSDNHDAVISINNNKIQYQTYNLNTHESVTKQVAFIDDIPTNYVTTDTHQIITGNKIFNNNVKINGELRFEGEGGASIWGFYDEDLSKDVISIANTKFTREVSNSGYVSNYVIPSGNFSYLGIDSNLWTNVYTKKISNDTKSIAVSDIACMSDLSTKLTAVTTTSTADRVYAIKSDGTQYTFEISNNKSADTIARRSSSGTLRADTPISSNDLTTKKYVDDLDSANIKLTGDQNMSGVKSFSDGIKTDTITGFGDLIIKSGNPGALNFKSDMWIWSNMYPVNGIDIGTADYKLGNLYISGNLSDGTNSINVSQITNKATEIDLGNNLFTLTNDKIVVDMQHSYKIGSLVFVHLVFHRTAAPDATETQKIGTLSKTALHAHSFAVTGFNDNIGNVISEGGTLKTNGDVMIHFTKSTATSNVSFDASFFFCEAN